ncbi:FKBP-type peptidyl-prolyl cis-trans isomerase [Flavobacterium sp. CSZ]|uniref:FKBP-type peptidyl-prolyl cis-trans isomerase n=1 Tax=Flavobacterium sp. CSZ TaxID=2783791 RepID=UPI00188B598B|nr:FKBP-type peptidyl-prolyl cis-trans isomerase [Flavobacterium sp. CSZ]MBF4488153.1 FKBP-type peptidyl-prolyl cis-trans isomerase [Flavobacterium sp. CSZ]
MNKFKYYFILLLAGIAIVSCNKSDDDDVVTVPLRDYKEQYKADNDSIVNYLKTNYIKEVTPNFDIVIEKIPAGGTQTSIWDQKEYPLQTRPVYSNDVNYEVYFLSLRKGTGSSPTNTDKIVASYSGNFLNGKVFDSSYGNAETFNLFAYSPEGTVIEGWSEIFPQFRTGTSTTSTGTGVITYDNYGAGVMFIPSGLAYYASGKGTIPAYTSIVFSFKLFDLQRMDNEYTISSSTGGVVILGDGVPDYLEDINGDGYLYDFRNTTKYPNPPKKLIDDTDKDGIADFVDFDDDGDGFSTRFELTKPTNEIGIVKVGDVYINYGTGFYYPWDAREDNPATPNTNEFEPRGIPRKPTGANGAFVEEDYTAAGRLRIHLDKTYPIKKN